MSSNLIPFSPAKPRRLAPLLFSFVCAIFFVAVAADVTHNGKLVQADRVVAPYLYAHANGTLTFLAACASGMGEPRFVVPYVIAGAIFLAVRRRRRALAVWVVGFVGCDVLCESFKWYFHVPRPSQHLSYVFGDHPGYSFPSGHTMAATVSVGIAVLVLAHVAPRTAQVRCMMAAGVAALGMLVAAALVYVGVHYVTDVLGGLALSAAWLGVLRAFLPPAVPRAASNEGSAGQPQEISASGG